MKFHRVFVIALILSGITFGYSSQLHAAKEKTPTVVAEKPDEAIIYVRKRKKPLNVLYKSIFLALENNGYFVSFEPNIGKKMEQFAQRWGKDYNRNNLEEIRSMVLSNPWYANKLANADPNLLALFPLHITLIEKGNITTIVFVRPGKVARDSRGQALAEELEKDVIRIVENAL